MYQNIRLVVEVGTPGSFNPPEPVLLVKAFSMAFVPRVGDTFYQLFDQADWDDETGWQATVTQVLIGAPGASYGPAFLIVLEPFQLDDDDAARFVERAKARGWSVRARKPPAGSPGQG